MNIVAKKISETRKAKGLTQEELAEKSKVNLRTIQRIENNESEPRGKTLNLICDALQMDTTELTITENGNLIGIGAKIVNGLFLVALNLVLMGIIGFLTLDSNANMNSRFGGILISIFLPIFIVLLTEKMNGMERMLKFGFGYIVYFILVMITQGFPVGFITGLFPCLLLSLSVLYFGQELIKDRHQNAE
jgi:transcriptional regulator with XRE-family HTH domain